MTDREANRFSARAARYARVGTNMSGVAARIAGARLFGITLDRGKSWIDASAGIDYLDIHKLVRLPLGEDRYLVSSARGLYAASDPVKQRHPQLAFESGDGL